MIPYLSKVGKRFVLSTTQNYWERNPLSRTNTGKSEVDVLFYLHPKRGLNSCKGIYFVPQRRAMLERGLLKFLEQVSCSSYFNYWGIAKVVRYVTPYDRRFEFVYPHYLIAVLRFCDAYPKSPRSSHT